MNVLLSLKKALLLSTAIFFGLTFTSWRGGVAQNTQTAQDTVPTKTDKKIVDLDEALSNLDDVKIDLDKTMHNIDWQKMNVEIKDAMKDLDVKLKDMNVDLKKSLQEIDVEKMKRDVNDAVAKIDWNEIKQNIDQAKKIDLPDVKAEIEKQKPQIEKSLQDARKEVEKAKVQLSEYKSFVNDLERDGLINKNEGYKIEHKDGQLIINGKVQPADVYNKYRTFLEKNKTFTLEKNSDGFNIKGE